MLSCSDCVVGHEGVLLEQELLFLKQSDRPLFIFDTQIGDIG